MQKGKRKAKNTQASPVKAESKAGEKDSLPQPIQVDAPEEKVEAQVKVEEEPKPVVVEAPKPSSPQPTESSAKPTESGPKDPKSSDYYFDSYSHFGIHEEMLKDEVRTRTYMRSIMNNKHLFKDKIVLDVGCGTGILCMFAAKAGAKKVFGIECASIVHQAREIIRANGFQDVITIIQGKVEEVDLPVEKVDIIISEWMGYFLLYESMLDTVIVARDRWLAADGALYPDKASLYLAVIEDAEYREDKINFWENVYGFDMSSIKELALLEPLVDVCEAKQVMSDSCVILNIDLKTVKKEELDFSSEFKLTVTRDDQAHALVAYFSVEFSHSHTKIGFSTGPKNPYTHWKQTVFYFNDPIPCSVGDPLFGRINVKRNGKNPRDIDIELSVRVDGKNTRAARHRHYRLR